MTELKFSVNDIIIYKTYDKVWRAGTIVKIDKDYVKINCEKHGKLFQNKEQETFVTIFDDAEKDNLRFNIKQIKDMIPFNEYNKFVIGTTDKTYEQKFNKWIENNNVKIGDYVEIIKAEEFVINRCHDPRLAESMINNPLIINEIFVISDITSLGVSIVLAGGLTIENIPYVITRKLNLNNRNDQKRIEKLMEDKVNFGGLMFNKGDAILYRTIYHQEWLRGGFIEYSTNTNTTIIDGVNYTSDPYEVITFTNKQHKVVTMKKHEVTIIPYNDTNKNLEFTNGKPYASKFEKWKKTNNIKPSDIVEIIKVSNDALKNCYKRDYANTLMNRERNKLFKIISFTEFGVNIQSLEDTNIYFYDIPYTILSKLDENRESDKNRLAKFNLQTGERTLTSLLDDKLFKNYQYKFNKWIEENKIQKNTKIKLHTYIESEHPYLKEIAKKYHYATGIFPFVPKNGYIVNTMDKDCLVMVKFCQEHNPDKMYFSKVPYEWIEVIPELDEIDIEMVVRVNGGVPYSERRKVLLDNNTFEHEIKFEDIEVILNDKQEHLLTILNKIKLNKTNNYQKRELLLVRNEDTDIWNFGLYLETHGDSVIVKTNLDTPIFKQHIKYAGNEHLAYTNKK